MSYITLEELTGSTLLLGIDRYDHEGNRIEPLIKFGRVIGAYDEEGIALDAGEPEPIHLPLEMDVIYLAPRGTYQAVATGQVIDDPDYFTMWKSTALPPPDTSTDWTPYFAPIANGTIGLLWEFEYRHDGMRVASLIDAKAAKLVGQTIIVGVAYYDKVGDEDRLAERKQFAGTITQVSFAGGLIVTSLSGEAHVFPPDITMVQPASPGEYHLRSTGEVVVDPGFIATWAVTRPPTD